PRIPRGRGEVRGVVRTRIAGADRSGVGCDRARDPLARAAQVFDEDVGDVGVRLGDRVLFQQPPWARIAVASLAPSWGRNPTTSTAASRAVARNVALIR